MNPTRKSNKKQALNQLILLAPYFKNYKFPIFLVFFALITTSIVVLFLGKIVKYLIDFGFAQNQVENLNLVLIKFFLAIAVLAVAGYFRSSLINEVGEKAINELRQNIFRRLIFTASQFFETNKIGDVISRLTSDITLLYSIMSTSLAFALRNLLLFLGGLIFLFLTSPKLTLISLILLPLCIIPIIFLGKKVKNLSLQSQEKMADLTSHLEESINGIKTIQAYSAEEKEAQNFNILSNSNLALAIKKVKVRALLIAIIIAIAFSFVGIVIWLGSHEVISGKMSAGSLSSFIFYAIICATSLVSLSQISSQLQTASAATKRIFELTKIESPIKEIKNPQKLPESVISGKNLTLQFKNVTFSYPSRQDIKILENFNLKIKNKERIALVGPSGAGKSTVLELLMRFFDCEKGQVLINSKLDVKDLALKDLRSLFSYISQDCFIFSGTILDNLILPHRSALANAHSPTQGGDGAFRSHIEKLIRSNKAFDFIEKLPNGIDSYIGQKGIKLSGGERQRIALLRALINDAPILLLDEATSALDNKNEKLITGLIEDLAKDKMVIYIAHRLSSIIHVDRIIFMKDGKITEEGSHEELMKKDGSYKNLLMS